MQYLAKHNHFPSFFIACSKGLSVHGQSKEQFLSLPWFFNCKKIDARNIKLLELRKKSVTEQKKVTRDQRKEMLKEKKEKSEAEALLSAVKVLLASQLCHTGQT